MSTKTSPKEDSCILPVCTLLWIPLLTLSWTLDAPAFRRTGKEALRLTAACGWTRQREDQCWTSQTVFSTSFLSAKAQKMVIYTRRNCFLFLCLLATGVFFFGCFCLFCSFVF